MFKRYLVVLISSACLFSQDLLVEVRGAYFNFACNTAKRIYGTGAPDIEFEVSYILKDYFVPFVNIGYVWKNGYSENLHHATELKMGTASVGSKFIIHKKPKKIDIYLGVGLTAAYLHLKNDSDYVEHITTKWSPGFVSKLGSYIYLPNDYFLDLFFDYYYQPFKTIQPLEDKRENVGGFRSGLGVGKSF
jgi:hypothetical protein